MPPISDLSDLEIGHVSLTAQGIDQDAYVRLAKAAAPKKETSMPQIPDALRKALGDETSDALTEEQAKALEALFPTAPDAPVVADPAAATVTAPAVTVESAIVAAPAVATADAPAADAVVDADVAKSAGMVALEKSLKDTQDLLAAERTLREERDFVAENTGRFEHLGDGAEAVAKSWFAIGKGIGTDDDRKRLDEALAGASAQIAKAPVVGAELGTSTGAGDVVGMSTIATLAKAARSDNPDLSESDATARVMATPEGQAAYEAYDEGRRARIRDAR
jgi:hypothetical protein